MTTLSPRAIQEKLALLLPSGTKRTHDGYVEDEDGTIKSRIVTIVEGLWNVCLLLSLQKEGFMYNYTDEHGKTLCDLMWSQTEELRTRALKSRFLQQIKTGMLDPVFFAKCMVQEAVFCQEAKQALEVAVKKCDEKDLKHFLEEKAKGYKMYYEQIFRDMNIVDTRGIHLGNSCQHYVKILNSTARNSDPVYMLVASIPSARLWPWIGKQLTADMNEFGCYTTWVKHNLNADSISYKKYEKIINNHPRIDQADAITLYTKCMEGEVGLFSTAEEDETKKKYVVKNSLETQSISEQPILLPEHGKTKTKTERILYKLDLINHPFSLWRHQIWKI